MEVILIMKCTFCGAELNDDVMFCTECGRAVEAAPAEPTEAFVKADKDPGKVLGIIAMILGIVAVVLPILCSPCCCCGYGTIVFVAAELVAFICAVAGLILAVLASKKSKAAGYKNGLAKLGLILSIVSLIFVAIIVVLVIVLIVLYIALIALGMGTSIMGSMYY